MIKPDITVTEKHLRKGCSMVLETPVLWFQLWELMRERMMGDSRTKLKEKIIITRTILIQPLKIS